MRTFIGRCSGSPRAFAACPLLFVSAISACGAGAMPESIAHPLAGVQAPEFHERSTSAREVGIPGRRRTRVTVVDFWATWCPACQISIPALDSLFRDHKDDGLMVIGINVGEPEPQAAAGAQSLGASFPIVADRGQRLSAQYGVAQIPLTFVIDRDGIVRWVGTDSSQATAAALVVLAE
jgi:cytochrome c biogenesis protein CcmG/thiol:disulfide interchange protein DsbE